MQPCKHKIASTIGAAVILGASSASNAASESFTITAQAIPDVQITTVQPLDFNTNIFVAAGGSCLMQATVPGDVNSQMQYDGATDAAANYGDIAGTGCVDGTATGQPGIYRIAGLSGASVNVTISDSAGGGDVTFTPNSGCIVTYDGTVAADSCDAFVPGVSASKKLAAATEDASTVGSDSSVDGQLIFTVGGTLTVVNELAPNFTGSINYNVEVVY